MNFEEQQTKFDSSIIVMPIIIDGALRIGVKLANGDEGHQAIKNIEGRLWSAMHYCWHLPYNRDSWNALKSLFYNIEIIENELVKTTNKTSMDYLDSAFQTHKSKIKNDNDSKISVHRKPNDEKLLQLQLPAALINEYLPVIKQIHGRKWNDSAVCWEIPYTRCSLRFLERYLPNELIEINFIPDYENIPDNMEPDNVYQKPIREQVKAQYEQAVTALEQVLLLKRYSWRTIKGYKNTFRQFIMHYNDTKPSQITRAQIDSYVVGLIRQQKISESYQNQILSAIKMFYTEVIPQAEKAEKLLRPKKPQKLPTYFSANEVERLLAACDNLKHKCILMLVYSGGLRLGEVTALKINNLYPNENRMHIKNGKGKKDRYTILSPNVWEKIKQYMDIYKPVEYLFEGVSGGKYSDRSVQAIFQQARAKSGVNEFGTVHTLRHSFATHLVDSGIALSYVQELLGHESIKTTEIYLHLTKAGFDKIKSPIDNIKF